MCVAHTQGGQPYRVYTENDGQRSKAQQSLACTWACGQVPEEDTSRARAPFVIKTRLQSARMNAS